MDVNGKVYAKVITPGYVAYNKTGRGKSAYTEYLFSKIFPRKTTIHDADGGTTVIEFARHGERVNDHPVLGEFAVKKLTPFGDKVSQDVPGVKKKSVGYQVNQAAQEHLRQQNASVMRGQHVRYNTNS